MVCSNSMQASVNKHAHVHSISQNQITVRRIQLKAREPENRYIAYSSFHPTNASPDKTT